MRRLAPLLAAVVALAAVAGAADARPRKQQQRESLRGHVSAQRAGLPASARARPLPAPGGAAAGPGAPGVPAPAPGAVDPPAPPPPPPPPGGSARSVQARTDDRAPAQLRLLLSRTTVLPGQVKLEFNNVFAQDPHDLLVERVDGTGPAFAFDELEPEQVQSRTLTLDAGAWRLSCTIATHAARGMEATLTVAG